ncbi:MAG: DUF1573 domain-containing protein [Bacteroidales bacterium]|nr:DUF1573 domain-containing protein [Bacteroidales bacterium]
MIFKVKKYFVFIFIAASSSVLFWQCGEGRKHLNGDIVNNPVTVSGDMDLDELPRIEYDKLEHDFGKILEGEVVSYGFRFRNTGKSDLIISNVSTSCGCTVPKFPRIPIKPGEEKVLTVTFDSHGRRGLQTKTITVLSNTQPNKTYLKIRAMIVAP